jgi:hypothetical protein
MLVILVVSVKVEEQIKGFTPRTWLATIDILKSVLCPYASGLIGVNDRVNFMLCITT